MPCLVWLKISFKQLLLAVHKSSLLKQLVVWKASCLVQLLLYGFFIGTDMWDPYVTHAHHAVAKDGAGPLRGWSRHVPRPCHCCCCSCSSRISTVGLAAGTGNLGFEQISMVGLAAVSFSAVGEAPPCLGFRLVRIVAGGCRLLMREAPPRTGVVAGMAGCRIEFVRSQAWRGKC